MITSIILLLLYGLIWTLTAPFRLFDDVVVASGFSGAIDFARSYISIFDYVIPLETLFSVFSLILLVKYYNVIFRILNWTIKKIPFIN